MQWNDYAKRKYADKRTKGIKRKRGKGEETKKETKLIRNTKNVEEIKKQMMMNYKERENGDTMKRKLTIKRKGLKTERNCVEKDRNGQREFCFCLEFNICTLCVWVM